MSVTINLNGMRLVLASRRLREGFPLAAAKYGWLAGRNLPQSSQALERAAASEGARLERLRTRPGARTDTRYNQLGRRSDHVYRRAASGAEQAVRNIRRAAWQAALRHASRQRAA